MASNLISTADLRKSSIKLMQDNLNNLWMWLAGIAAIQFVLTYWISSQIPQAGSGVMMEPPMGGVFSPVVILVLVGSVLVTIGLLRDLLAKAMPNGTKILGYWMTVVELLVAGIIIGLISGVGFLVFILPGIWLAISFSFASFEIVSNGQGIWSGPVSSFKLVKGRWWGVFGRFMMAFVWIILAEIVCTIIIGIISFVISAIGLAAVGTVVSDLLRSVLAAAIAYFTMCWNINVYRSLKAIPAMPTQPPSPAPATAAKA